jgi:hypothetical protein
MINVDGKAPGGFVGTPGREAGSHLKRRGNMPYPTLPISPAPAVLAQAQPEMGRDTTSCHYVVRVAQRGCHDGLPPTLRSALSGCRRGCFAMAGSPMRPAPIHRGRLCSKGDLISNDDQLILMVLRVKKNDIRLTVLRATRGTNGHLQDTGILLCLDSLRFLFPT